MNSRINPPRSQFRHEFVPLRRDFDRVLVVDMTTSRAFDRSLHDALQGICQVCCISSAPLRKILQFLNLGDAKSRLQLRHAHVIPKSYLIVTSFLPVVAQQSHLLSNGRIVGRNHPTLTSRHVLGCVERKTTSPETSHRSSIDCRSMRLRRIFNEYQRKSLCNFLQPIHFTWMTIQVHGYDRFGATCKCPFRLDRIERAGILVRYQQTPALHPRAESHWRSQQN